MNADPIEDFILANKANLSIAVAVAEGWPRARTRMVTDFLGHLRNALEGKLENWKYDASGEYFKDRYPGFYFWKGAWANQYSVRLEFGNYGRNMIFGISRVAGPAEERAFSGELLAGIKQPFPSARARKFWEADITMQSPAKDWTSPEVLWRMHSDPKFLADVAGQLLAVAKIGEPIIDRLAQKK